MVSATAGITHAQECQPDAFWPKGTQPNAIAVTTMKRRAALRDDVLEPLALLVPVEAAEAGEHGDVLPAVVGVGDRLGVDARAGLELPHLLTGRRIERDELAGLLAGEQEPAAGRQHRRP